MKKLISVAIVLSLSLASAACTPGGADRNDPLAGYDRVVALARDWGSHLVDLGHVGHLNPASGFGEWPQALSFVDELTTARSPSCRV